MADLDLDIRNYSVADLEAFFRMRANKVYSAADIEQKEYKIRQVLLKSGHIDKRSRTDLLDFLSKAKNILIFAKCGDRPTPTSLPKVPQLDATQYREPASAREGNLVKRPDTPYVNTFSSEYYEGVLNPLATRTIKKCLTIDTRFRTNYYATKSSDFTIQLPIKLTKIVSMQLSSFEIPVAFYGISSYYGNNYLLMEITYLPNGGGDPITQSNTFIIPDGNYNAVDFVHLINGILCPTTSTGELIDPTNMFSYVQLSLNVQPSGSGTGKVTVSSSGVLASQITNIKMDFSRDIHGNSTNSDISQRIGWNLGFIHPIYDGSCSYVAETIIEPATIRYIYLAVDDFNNSVNNHFITAFSESIMNPNILARIALNGSYFSLMMENDLNIVSEPRKYFGPVDIQRLRIRLYDDRGRILDMNHSNYSFCLVFTMLYDL